MYEKKAIDLKVPLIKQRTKYDCSIACGLMIHHYYKKDIEYNEFIVKKDTLGRANIFDLAISLKKNGLKPSMLFFNYSFFDDAHFLSLLKNIADEGILGTIKECILKKIQVRHKIFFVRNIEKLLISKTNLNVRFCQRTKENKIKKVERAFYSD